MASMANAILIEDEDDSGQQFDARLQNQGIPEGFEVIDLDELEDEDDEDEQEPVQGVAQHQRARGDRFNIRDIYQQPALQRGRRKAEKVIAARNPPVKAPFVTLPNLKFGDRQLHPQRTVELNNGEFLRITQIIQDDRTEEVFIRGLCIRRNREIETIASMLPRKTNEVCLCFEVDLDDPRSSIEQSAIQISLSEVLKIRRLTFTNLPFPEGRAFKGWHSEEERQDILNNGLLLCRWTFTTNYASAADRLKNKFRDSALVHFTALELNEKGLRAPQELMVAEREKRRGWRGETIAAGEYRPSLKLEDDDELTLLSDSIITPSKSGKRKTRHFGTSTPTKLRRNAKARFSPLIRKRATIIELDTEPQNMTDGPIKLDGPSPMTPSHRVIKSPYSQVSTTGKQHRPSLLLGSRISTPVKRHIPSTLVRSLSSTSIQTETGTLLSKSFSTPVLGTFQSVPLKPFVIRSGKGTETRPTSSFAALPSVSIPRGISALASGLSTPPASGFILNELLKPRIDRLPGQKYTYGDAFCGSGGMTRGAKLAGLHVKWGFDFDSVACETWRQNFSKDGAVCYEMRADEFIKQMARHEESARVDILHISCPCQFYSPAHTRVGKNDEMNTASLFAVGALVRLCKPRIVTLEQTFGILLSTKERRPYFLALINMLSVLNYSVRWEVVALQTWGVPQRRYRLIMIASCPGEILPSIPAGTHAENPPRGSNLKPFVTVGEALASIPANTPDHDIRAAAFPDGQTRAPWDKGKADKIFPRCLTTTADGKVYHPSGKRNLTVRDYAKIQTYPDDHVFAGGKTDQLKQIGNSVPCEAARVLLSSIIKELDKADGVSDPPILIPDDDDDDSDGTIMGDDHMKREGKGEAKNNAMSKADKTTDTIDDDVRWEVRGGVKNKAKSMAEKMYVIIDDDENGEVVVEVD